MDSIEALYLGPVGRALGGSYQIRSLRDGAVSGNYIVGGCWVLGKIAGRNAVEFSPTAVGDPNKSIQTAISILGEQVDLRDRLQAGGIEFNAAYFQELKPKLGEAKAVLIAEKTKLLHITPQDTERRQRLETFVWLGTSGDMAFPSVWQDPKQRASELVGQISSLDVVMARL